MCFFSQDFDLQAVQDQDEDPCQVKIQGPAEAVPRPVSLTRFWGVAKWVRFRSILLSSNSVATGMFFSLGIPPNRKMSKNKSWWWLLHLTWGQCKNFSWRWLPGWNHQHHTESKYLTFEVKKAREMILELRLGTASINFRIGEGHEKTKIH